ncbi:MAG: hypothetical protein ACLVHE_03330 [Dialister invisus]
MPLLRQSRQSPSASIHNVVYNLKATQIHADAGVANAVPGTATITFDFRSRDNDVMELMIQKLRAAAGNAAASIGAKADFTILHQIPASIITPEITEIIVEVITSELGEKACIPPIVTAEGEDFFWYPKMKPELKQDSSASGEECRNRDLAIPPCTSTTMRFPMA